METQQTEPTTQQHAPALPEGGDDASLDTRASALLDQLKGEQKDSARAAQTETTEAPVEEPKAEPAAKTEETAPSAEKTAEQIATERRERIAARQTEVQRLADEERARVAASRAKKQERQQPETPAAASGVSVHDVASFWAAAEKLAIPPQDLASWLTAQNDPAKAAQHAAKSALSPVEQKLKELEERQAAWEAQQTQAAQQAQLDAVVERNFGLISEHLETVKAEAPLSNALRAKNPAKYRKAVESVCDGLPPGFTAQDVIDNLEEELLDLQLNGSTSAPAAPASTTKRTEKPAAAKANVGNRLAAERATTVEDDGDDAELDLDERARKLKARLAAAG